MSRTISLFLRIPSDNPQRNPSPGGGFIRLAVAATGGITTIATMTTIETTGAIKPPKLTDFAHFSRGCFTQSTIALFFFSPPLQNLFLYSPFLPS